ncbi:MAG TPA: thymidine kinase, partial [Bacilli bacterium]|nr:thymidine kinase [Bacilli bacterium]
MDTINRPGWIEIVTGPMFAGKSEELIRRIKRLEYAKKKVLVFRPRIDNRYSLDEVVSHSNNRRKSIVIDAAKDILPFISEDTYAVVIDEIQFLDHELIPLSEHLANIGIRVILGGLDSDFRGEPFAVTSEMMARAEFVTKLTAICVRCGSPATKTQRIVNGKPAHYLDPIVVVGAA